MKRGHIVNVILVLIDSMNRHYLTPYGSESVVTPNIGELAYRGVTFTNHFMGSAPCMPARLEMMTGRQEFLHRGWWHIEPFDVPIAARLRGSGVLTQMVTDHYHYWEPSAHGYIEYFDGCEMVRGSELDYWKTEPQPKEPEWVESINKHRPGWGSRYYKNVANLKGERDFFSPRVFAKAAEWIDANCKQDRFFLQIESFDPHEPFHVPEPYRSMHTKDLNARYTCWPPYQDDAQRREFLRNTSMEEISFIRAQYQGKLAMVDKSLGAVWSAMDRHKLWGNTMVIITSDHGHDLGEAIGSLDEVTDDARDKTLRIPFGKQHPHYLSHANTPLIVWHPGMEAGRCGKVDAITSAVDLYATVLDALGVEGWQGLHSRSIMPLLGGKTKHRELAYWGTFGQGICCTDGEHVLLQGANSKAPLYWYSALMDGSCADAETGKFIKGVSCPVWRIPRKSEFDFPSILYRRDDPLFKETNIIEHQAEVAVSMRKRLRERVLEDGCPSEQLDRLGL